VRLTDGTSVILHINRLKRSYEQAGNNIVLPLDGSSDKAMKLGRTKRLAPKEYREMETKKLNAENPARPQIVDVGIEESDRSDKEIISPSQARRTVPEWTPGSSYLQRKLQSSNTVDKVAYSLRSRLVSRSERETEIDKQQAETLGSQGSEHMLVNTQNETSSGKIEPAISHSYNLRIRVESTNNKAQE
jgi:hypothetical protein